MIVENIKDKRIRDIVTRICDLCKKKDKITLAQAIYSKSFLADSIAS